MEPVTPSDNALEDRLIPRTEAIPVDPAPGNYVIIDVLHFSTTVIELLANGADRVHVTAERGDEFAYKRDHPDAVIGGGATEYYEPTAGYDFFNSPSYVQDLDLDGRPAALWSSNGGRALVALRERLGPDSALYVGSTTNARVLAAHLARSDRPTYLVSAGSKGEIAEEDLVGATLISRYMDGLVPAQTELDLFASQVETAKGEAYVDRHPIRRRDVREFAMAIDARSVIPELEGEALVARPEAVPEPLPSPQAAD
jgi:2-phosphosulfolactate phosphatase